MALRAVLLLGLLAGTVEAAWGKKDKKDKNTEGMAGIMEDFEGEADAAAAQNANLAQEYAAAGARDYEVENLARHRAGELNDAELGMANMQQAMKDPSAMAEMAKMMQDPENQMALKKMMADPGFQAQAKRMAEQMKASGAMPDAAQIQQMMKDPNVMAKAQQMAQAMGMTGGAGGMGGMGGMGGAGGGSAAAELARLQAENAALRQKMEL